MLTPVFPIPVIMDQSGKPLNNGALYVGEPDQDPEVFPKPAFWDADGTDPIDQTGGIPVIGGYIRKSGSPGTVYAEDEYSTLVRDRFGAQIYYSPRADNAGFIAVREEVFASLAATGGASLVGGAVQTVTSRAVMAALGVNAVRSIAIIGDESLWQWRTGDYTARVASDPLRGIYQPHATIATSTGCWVRQWDGVTAKAEWFGAVINDPGTDCYAALQACLDVTGILTLGKGIYYSSRGIHLPDYCVVDGLGESHSGIQVDHATDHLMWQRGVASVSYAGGAHLSKFALGRTPNPTTPASSADDITQGHGLHFFMVTNPMVTDVFCYNNLVENYVGSCLSPHFRNTRGIRSTGGAGDRWYGLYVDGFTPGSIFGGPSPNPSSTFIKPNMGAAAAVGQSYNYYLKGALQDLWMVDPEAGGGHIQFFIDSQGATAGDFHIIRPIADAYRTHAFFIDGVPLGSTLNIEWAWVAPSSVATSPAIRLNECHGITISAKGDFSLSSGSRCFDVNDSSGIVADLRTTNCQYPVYATQLLGSEVKLTAYKYYTGADFGVGISALSCLRTRFVVNGRSFGTQKYLEMVSLDNTSANCMVDVSGVMDGAAASRVSIAGTPITTQGNVSGHVILNPGAGAML